MDPLQEANRSVDEVQSQTGEPQLNNEFYLSFDDLPIQAPIKERDLSVLVDEAQFQPFAISDQESFRTGGTELQYPTGVNYPDIELGFTERRDLPVMRTFYERWQAKIWNKPSGGQSAPGARGTTSEGQAREANEVFSSGQVARGTFNPPAQWMGGFSLFPLNSKSGAGNPPEYKGYYEFIDVYPTDNDPITFNHENTGEITQLTLNFHVHHVVNHFQ